MRIPFVSPIEPQGPQAQVTFDELWNKVMLGEATSLSGVTVNVTNALKVATFLACCRVLAEDTAQLPVKLIKTNPKTKEKTHADYLRLAKVLELSPNEWMTSFEWRETMMYHALATGNAYSIINRTTDGKDVYELLPLMPNAVQVEQDKDWDLVYTVTLADGGQMKVAQDNMFHLRGPSWDGVIGMDVLDLARESLGLAIATEQTHAKLHKNSAKPGGIISVDGTLSKESKKRLVETWNAAFGGGNNYRTAVLDQNAKWIPMMMSGVDAQHLETRRFQIEEICRQMRVFPQMIGHTDKTATFASAEAFFLAHVVYSLGPWIRRWEQAIDKRLIKFLNIRAKFSVQGLLRGDHKARSQFYKDGILSGWLKRNEARALEDLNAIEGLDEPLVPVNMTTQEGMQKMIDNAGQGPGSPAEPPDEQEEENDDAD